jgi:enoyl-CoA hydratase
VRNCVDGATAAALLAAYRRFEDDAGAKVLVLTGAGDKAFSAGADLKAIDTVKDRAEGPLGISRLTPTKPTIAAVAGYCVAGGIELALWCDLRIVARGAVFGCFERRFGVPLIDGGTQRLPRIVGIANALYLIETGVLIGAEQAQRMGLVQEVVPEGQALERALHVAETLSGYPQQAMRNDRLAALGGMTLTEDEGLKFEMETHRRSVTDPLMAEWLAKYAGGERPAPLRPPE